MNLAIVFFATGLWHGATTAFIAWGALHGFFIIVERIGFKKILDKIGFLRYVYILGNAKDEVKAKADFVCKSVEDDGIYHYCVENKLIF